MFIFSEFNVFRPADAKSILQKAHAALNADGVLLLEPHTFAVIEQIGSAGPSWESAETGLFSDRPHLCLDEHFWDAESCTATARYYIIDTATAKVTRHGDTMQAYTEEQYESLLKESGFDNIELHPAMGDSEDVRQEGLFVIVARKV